MIVQLAMSVKRFATGWMFLCGTTVALVRGDVSRARCGTTDSAREEDIVEQRKQSLTLLSMGSSQEEETQDLRYKQSNKLYTKTQKKLNHMRNNMLKGREGNRAAQPSTDLLVCFPSRAHLSLMPKPICSPARPSEPNKRLQQHHRRNRSISRCGGSQGSPMLWNKTKSMSSEISEPTSPKVTCAGQIKVRPKSNGCRSWQSVMEEIEKIHNDKKQKKRLNWAESLGFKKEVMQFLTCLRTIRFDLRCFGSFSGADVVSDDEEDEDDEEEEEDEVYRENENHVGVEESENEGSRTVFSKWFMVMQEDQNKEKEENGEEESAPPPPPNALLLMRCRSAPAKSWLRESEGGGDDGHNEKEEESQKEKEKEKEKVEVKRGHSLRSLMEEEKMVVRCHSDYYDMNMSSDIATETWIVGGIRDIMSRSRSWKR